MMSLVASFRTAAAGFMRPAAAALLLLWAALMPAHAATYAFRSDTYSWETTANTITGWDGTCTGYPVDDDKVTLAFTGGFTFTFAGTAYSSVRVLSNGMLQFGADAGFHRTYTNTTLPAAAPGSYGSGSCANAVPTNVIMGYWMDLKPYSSINSGGGGTVTWEQKGTAPNRYFVVSWNAVYQYNTTTPYTFQIILYENGEFKYQYGNNNASGSNATIGVQVSSTDYTLYSYKSGYNANGSAIRWFIASGTPSRLANYRFDEFSYTGAVGEVVDSSGNSHNGTAVGGAQTTASGYVCRALDVPANTTASAITAVDSAVPVPSLLGSDGSVSFWVRSNVVWTSNTAAMLFDATTVANRPFYLMRSGGGALKFAVADSAGTILTATSTTQSFAAGTWVHVAATWRLASGTNASVLRIYVNGVQVGVANGTTNGAIDPGIGTLFFGDNRSNLTPSGGTVNSANGAIDEASLYNYEISAVEIAADMAVSHSCSTLHHVEIHGSASGLTCTPATFTIVACQDSACTVNYTGGVVGTLSATGTGMTVNWPDGTAFSIPSGSASVDMRMQLATVGSVSVTASGMSPSAANATTCNFGSPSCTFSAVDSGLLFSVPNHVSETSQSITVSAVKKADNSLACTPAFASASKSVSFTCSYANPASGTLPVRVGGTALNGSANAGAACDATGKAVTLAFNSSGVATTTVQYADAGQMTLNARYTGSGSDAGLVMNGASTFVAAPGSFKLTGLPAGNIAAADTFSATVTAYNGAATPAATPNFGKESPVQTPVIAFTRATPTGASASNGSFSSSYGVGTFSGGSASVSNLSWSEVGTGDLSATVSNYLASGLAVTGTTSGGALHFVPHHFDTTLSANGCGAFSYAGLAPAAGQAFRVDVTAMNKLNAVTTNYDGSLGSPASRNVALSEATPLGGTLTVSVPILASWFRAGASSGTGQHGTAYYAFAAKQTAPATLKVRATDTDGVSSSSGAPTEASVLLRSGRLRVANGFGSEKSPLALQLSTEYWNGSAWTKNPDDSCTALAAANVAFSNVRDYKGAAGTWTTTPSFSAFSGGTGTLTLSAPLSTGTADLAINLGSGSADQSCLWTHPASTGAGLPWLRSRNGAGPDAACSSSPWDRDPSARASFGIYSPETKKTVHARELF